MSDIDDLLLREYDTEYEGPPCPKCDEQTWGLYGVSLPHCPSCGWQMELEETP